MVVTICGVLSVGPSSDGVRVLTRRGRGIGCLLSLQPLPLAVYKRAREDGSRKCLQARTRGLLGDVLGWHCVLRLLASKTVRTHSRWYCVVAAQADQGHRCCCVWLTSEPILRAAQECTRGCLFEHACEPSMIGNMERAAVY